MANTNKTFDALVIPTGETTFGDRRFPVTNEAIKEFSTGKYGCIFITGGYSGFATLWERGIISEGKETYNYILGRGIKGINSDNVYYDDQSLESVSNFTFPIVEPMYHNSKYNPKLDEFDNMQIIAKKGHIWRLEDYARVVMPNKFKDGKIGFYPVPRQHNNGPLAMVYHTGIMNKIEHKNGAEEIHKFLIEEHPFYSGGWFDKSPLIRKLEMGAVGGLWLLGLK